MHHGAGVEIQPDSLFTLTSDQHVPRLVEMMKVKSAGEFKNLNAPTLGTKKKVHFFAVLTPFLEEAVKETDMMSSKMFLSLPE